MNKEPIICFGQQPCGFFPKRLLVAKIKTARELQEKIGGKIVYFYHDSDADYKETITIFEDPITKAEVRLNFLQENKTQKKYSPLYAKKIPTGWKEEILKKLPRLVSKEMIELFKTTTADNAADFCLDIYKKMGLFDGIEIVRSGSSEFREAASELTQYYADIPYEGEIVRAEFHDGEFRLHEGGGNYITVPTPEKVEKWQKNPGRDQRFAWMQSVVQATHYINGHGEGAYLKMDEFPDVEFVTRDDIDKSSYAYLITDNVL